MSARDDYPKAAGFADLQGQLISRWGEVAAALDEIDRLRSTITHMRVMACRQDIRYGGEYHADAEFQPLCCDQCPSTDEVARLARQAATS